MSVEYRAKSSVIFHGEIYTVGSVIPAEFDDVKFLIGTSVEVVEIVEEPVVPDNDESEVLVEPALEADEEVAEVAEVEDENPVEEPSAEEPEVQAPREAVKPRRKRAE